MKEVVTVDRMRQIEKASDEAGIDYLRLMERKRMCAGEIASLLREKAIMAEMHLSWRVNCLNMLERSRLFWQMVFRIQGKARKC